MKKILLLILINYSFFSFAQECSSDMSPVDTTDFTALAIPNCATRINLQLLKNGKKEKLCDQCLKDFKYKSLLPEVSENEDKEKRKKLFREKSIAEYKKVISNTMIDIVKLRALGNTGSSFSESLKSCNLSKATTSQVSPACQNSIKQIHQEISNIQGQLANELANIFSNHSTSKSKGLLNRSSSAGQTCQLEQLGLNEQQLLYLNASTFEDSLAPGVIEAFQKISYSGNDYNSLIQTLRDKVEVDGSGFFSHPILMSFANDPQNLIAMMKRVSPQTADKLREVLYAKENGNKLDTIFAKTCANAYNTLTASLCKKEYIDGDINPDINSSLKNIAEKYKTPRSEEFSNSEELVLLNKELNTLCTSSPSGLSFGDFRKEICKGIDSRYVEDDFQDFSTRKYSNDFTNIQDALCKVKDKTSCSEETTECKLFNKYQELQKQNTVDSKLANSSNEEVNSLLRAMIGNPKDITPETRKILVSQGILPKDDGKFVEQPKVPEREPDYFKNVASSQSSQKTLYNNEVSAGSAQMKQANAGAGATDSFYRAPSANNVASNDSVAPTQAPITTNIIQDMKDLSQINSEIARRLMNGSKGQTNLSRSDVRSVVEDVLKNQSSTPPTTAAVDNAVNDFYSEVERQRNQAPVGGQMAPGHASLAKSNQSEAQRRYNNQMNAALEGFGKGSSDVAIANIAADVSVKVQEGKDSMSKVEVFTSADKLEKANLADVLKLKAQKDAEGKRLVELVKKKENFILNVNKTSLMIKFDKASDTFEVIRIGSSGTPLDEKVVSEVRSFIKQNYSAVSLSSLKERMAAP